jgi:uncharacterized surface protein with fasciclin (FAS1) repeats
VNNKLTRINAQLIVCLAVLMGLRGPFFLQLLHDTGQVCHLVPPSRAFARVYAGTKPELKKQTISVAGRKRVAAAQPARWAKTRAKKGK